MTSGYIKVVYKFHIVITSKEVDLSSTIWHSSLKRFIIENLPDVRTIIS